MMCMADTQQEQQDRTNFFLSANCKVSEFCNDGKQLGNFFVSQLKKK